MYRKTINAHFSPYYLVAIPYGPRICFEVGTPIYETPEFIILTYGSITRVNIGDEYAGGILVVNKVYQRLLLEPHQTYDSARHSFKFWVRHLNDPRVEETQSTDQDSDELAHFGSDGRLKDFSILNPRKVASDGIIDMKFADEPLQRDVARAFEQKPDWEKVLLLWASTGFGEFTPLFHWRNQEVASRASKMFLEERLGTPSDEIPF